MKTIYKVTRYDFTNNRKDETTAQFFANSKATADFITMIYGTKLSYFESWSQKDIRTKKALAEVMDNLPYRSELHFFQTECVAVQVAVECFILHADWK